MLMILLYTVDSGICMQLAPVYWGGKKAHESSKGTHSFIFDQVQALMDLL